MHYAYKHRIAQELKKFTSEHWSCILKTFNTRMHHGDAFMCVMEVMSSMIWQNYVGILKHTPR